MSCNFSCLINGNARTLRKGHHRFTRVYFITERLCVFLGIPVAVIPLFSFDDSTNFFEILRGEANKIIDVVYALFRKFISAYGHV